MTYCTCIFQVRQVSYTIASGIQPIQNLSVLKYVGDEKMAEWGHHWINKGFHSKFIVGVFRKSGTQKMLCTLFLILLDCAHIKENRTSHAKHSAQGFQNPATDWNLESKLH